MRTGVWAEPNVVEKTAYEFDGMEEMVPQVDLW